MSKVLIKRTGGLSQIKSITSHAKYVGFRSNELHEHGFFGRETNNVDYRQFIERIKSNPALKHPNTIKAHKIVFSLRQKDYDAYKRSGQDYKDLIRATLKSYEHKHGVKLDWIANIHEKDGHPHAHVIIKGVSDEKDIGGHFKRVYFKKDDFKDLKEEFDKELDREAIYHWHENIDMTKTLSDISKGLSQVTNQMANEIENEQEKGERERMRATLKKKFKRPTHEKQDNSKQRER